jgi:hypothetical protein
MYCDSVIKYPSIRNPTQPHTASIISEQGWLKLEWEQKRLEILLAPKVTFGPLTSATQANSAANGVARSTGQAYEWVRCFGADSIVMWRHSFLYSSAVHRNVVHVNEMVGQTSTPAGDIKSRYKTLEMTWKLDATFFVNITSLSFGVRLGRDGANAV